MIVAVTGATGFLGGHIAEELLARGVAVVAVVRNPAKAAWLEARGAAVRRADLTDPAALAAAFAGVDAVVANAALAPGWERHDDRAFVDANVVGTRNVLNAAAEAGVRRVVQVSSIAVYRTSLTRAMDEEHPKLESGRPHLSVSRLTTDARYSASKAEAERVAWALARELDLALTAVRPGPIYGPRDDKVTGRYGRWNDRAITLAPTAGIPHVHAADVAAAIAVALDRPKTVGQAYNLGGPSVSPYAILRAWRRIAGAGARLVPVPVPLGVRIDDRCAGRDLDFAPRHPDDGLVDCVAWYRSSGS